MVGEGDDRGWDGWMASLTQRTWVWVNSRTWCWTGRPGVPQPMGSQSDTTERLNWTILPKAFLLLSVWQHLSNLTLFYLYVYFLLDIIKLHEGREPVQLVWYSLAHSVCLQLCRRSFGASQVALVVKKLPQCWRPKRHEFSPSVGKIPWRISMCIGWQPTPVFLPGEPHGQRSLVGYSP